MRKVKRKVKGKEGNAKGRKAKGREREGKKMEGKGWNRIGREGKRKEREGQKKGKGNCLLFPGSRIAWYSARIINQNSRSDSVEAGMLSVVSLGSRISWYSACRIHR